MFAAFAVFYSSGSFFVKLCCITWSTPFIQMSLLCIYFPNPLPSVSSLLTVGRQTISTSQSNLKYKYKYKYVFEFVFPHPLLSVNSLLRLGRVDRTLVQLSLSSRLILSHKLHFHFHESVNLIFLFLLTKCL